MKTFDKQDIFTCVTAEEAIAYIDNTGYFADALSGFNHIDCFAPYSLDEVQIGTDKPFVSRAKSYALFLPTAKIKEVEEPKKYRAFKDFEELSETLNKGVGSEIIYRLKNEPLRKITTSIVGFITENNREDLILIGINALPLSTYFKTIEIWNNVDKQWQPFGVEE